MISKSVIEEVKNRLVKTYNPIAIYLFGSYAWGTPNEDSDLDLLVVIETSEEKPFKRAFSGQRVLFGLGISKDLIIFTEKEFKKLSSDGTTLCHKIAQEGEVLYAK